MKQSGKPRETVRETKIKSLRHLREKVKENQEKGSEKLDKPEGNNRETKERIRETYGKQSGKKS